MYLRASIVAVALVAASVASPAMARIVWDEAVDGDLSGDHSAPTPIDIALGSNRIVGTTIFAPTDADFFKVEVAPGEALEKVVLDTYDYADRWFRDRGAFLGVERGGSFGVSGASMLGWALIGELPGTKVGDDVLDDLGRTEESPRGSGFEPPLGPGTYTFWYQQTVGDTGYELDLVVTPVPPALPLLAGAVIGLGLWRRRTSRHNAAAS